MKKEREGVREKEGETIASHQNMLSAVAVAVAVAVHPLPAAAFHHPPPPRFSVLSLQYSSLRVSKVPFLLLCPALETVRTQRPPPPT